MEQDYNITPSGYIYGRDPKSTVPFWNVDTLKSLNEEIDKLNGEIDDLNTQISSLNSQVETLENEKATLQNTINSLNSRIQQLENEIQNLTNQINDLNSQIQTLESEKENLQNQINDLNNQVSTLETENQNLTNQINNVPNYFWGAQDFPGNYTINFEIPSTWADAQVTNLIHSKLEYINCDNININFYENSTGTNYGTVYQLKTDIRAFMCKNLNLLYPNSSRIILYNSKSSERPNIHKFSVISSKTTLFNDIVIGIFSKSSTKYYMNQTIFEIKMIEPNDNINYNITIKGTPQGGLQDYHNKCIIFNYGNQQITELNITLTDGISDGSGISSLINTGLVFFVSDQNYDLFMSDPNWSQLGNNLRRLSEFNEAGWQ